jgi:sulfite exporter TauE/SafE
VDEKKETSALGAMVRRFTAMPGWMVAKKILRIVVGIVLILLGLVALFTPFTPGSWLAVFGLEFLGLRVLLRNWLCRRAAARPDSRLLKALCRVFSLDGLEAMKRRWRSRHPKSPR